MSHTSPQPTGQTDRKSLSKRYLGFRRGALRCSKPSIDPIEVSRAGKMEAGPFIGLFQAALFARDTDPVRLIGVSPDIPPNMFLYLAPIGAEGNMMPWRLEVWFPMNAGPHVLRNIKRRAHRWWDQIRWLAFGGTLTDCNGQIVDSRPEEEGPLPGYGQSSFRFDLAGTPVQLLHMPGHTHGPCSVYSCLVGDRKEPPQLWLDLSQHWQRLPELVRKTERDHESWDARQEKSRKEALALMRNLNQEAAEGPATNQTPSTASSTAQTA